VRSEAGKLEIVDLTALFQTVWKIQENQLP
jgi:hypothetical protein